MTRGQIIFCFIMAVPLAVLAYLLLGPVFRRWRWARLRRAAPPGELAAVLARSVRMYPPMPADLKEQLHRHVNVFLAEKEFIGCDGQEITDEIRYTIAGTACMLLLNREPSYFPGFTSILVYPDTYQSTEVFYDGDVEVHENSVRAGESWHRGPVVLSWGDVVRGADDASDGFNVVLHEFAHKLDEENAGTNGLPALHADHHYAEWAAVLGREYEELEKRVMRGDNHVLDDYGLGPSMVLDCATDSVLALLEVVLGQESIGGRAGLPLDRLDGLLDLGRLDFELPRLEWHTVETLGQLTELSFDRNLVVFDIHGNSFRNCDRVISYS